MSGAPRKRGTDRAPGGGQPAETSSRRGGGRLFAPGGFDGPASRGSASQSGPVGRGAGSSVGSGVGSPAPGSGFEPQAPTASSRRSSQSGGAPASQPAFAGGDPARDPGRVARRTDNYKNVDLPPSMYNIDHLYGLTNFTARPGFNTTGKAVAMNVNAFQVMQYPTVKIYQYDVIIGSGAEKRMVQRKVWESSARKSATGPQIIYDGNRLAWSMKDHGELRIMVDLDVEEGKGPSRDAKNAFRLHIKKTRELSPHIIQAAMEKKVPMDEKVLEAIGFMDHLLREGPSTNPQFVAVRRSLFKRGGQRSNLGGSIEVWRGVYQSLRMAEGLKTIVNLDVANSCFWIPSTLLATIVTKWREIQSPQDIAARMRPIMDNGTRKQNYFHKNMNGTFKGIEVKAVYKGNLMPDKTWKILRFDLVNAQEHQIEWKDPTTHKPTGEMIPLVAYFRRKYNVTLQYSQLPLVEMTKKGVKFPLEFLHIPEGQRYAQKLDENQTANMIKFAVSRPRDRLTAINEGKGWLNWAGDNYLKNYGLRINPNQIKTKATILPAPGIQFGNKVEQPGTRGRWDLKGKKFLNGNPQELVSWGIALFQNGKFKVDKSQIDSFALDFARAYRNHGGQVANAPPHIMVVPNDAGAAVNDLYQATGDKFKRRPQLMIFLVQDKNSFHYLRIKKSCDCRFGIVSQVMQIQQVLKGNPQYYSNVLMKVNAKLGGTTSQAKPSPQSGFKPFSQPTMIIGADVSHASPGSQQASTAAITVSFDRFGGRYAATCQTNGFRVEMVSEANWRLMFTPLVRQWMSTVGGGRAPAQIYYIRDGVSEGQFIQVMQQEVPHIKQAMKEVTNGQFNGKITVIIASKRHHIRAFPEKDGADQHGNPLPGTLIERDVTTPNEFDFYLYSHIALQGTSRPVHYSVLHDEANHRPDQIQNMLYEHCYQYMRSTTSVSLHPAAYYAHLASNRCKAHEDIPASDGPQGGAGFKAKAPSRSSEPSDTEAKPLMPLFNASGIAYSMWYI